MRELVEVGLNKVVAGASGRRTVTVNRRESVLAWLRARDLVTARQAEAGERLRADYERAHLGASVTMRWDGTPPGTRSTGSPEPGAPALDAKRRFDRALATVGPGLADVLWRTVCANEKLPDAERALGWPVRSGRVVLGLALDRLADAYRLP